MKTARGQVLVLMTMCIFFVAVLAVMTMAIGQRIREKAELQSIADVGAYNYAVATARGYNAFSLTNRVNVSQWASLAATHALFAYCQDTTGFKCGTDVTEANFKAQVADIYHSIRHVEVLQANIWWQLVWEHRYVDRALGDAMGSTNGEVRTAGTTGCREVCHSTADADGTTSDFEDLDTEETYQAVMASRTIRRLEWKAEKPRMPTEDVPANRPNNWGNAEILAVAVDDDRDFPAGTHPMPTLQFNAVGGFAHRPASNPPSADDHVWHSVYSGGGGENGTPGTVQGDTWWLRRGFHPDAVFHSPPPAMPPEPPPSVLPQPLPWVQPDTPDNRTHVVNAPGDEQDYARGVSHDGNASPISAKHRGIFHGGFGLVDFTAIPGPQAPDARDLGCVSPGDRCIVGPRDLYGQPKLTAMLIRDRSNRGNKAWEKAFSTNILGADAQFVANDPSRNLTTKSRHGLGAHPGLEVQVAVAAGLAYYHRRGHLKEPPNMMNPFWHATLTPWDIDVNGRAAFNQYQTPVYSNPEADEIWSVGARRPDFPYLMRRAGNDAAAPVLDNGNAFLDHTYTYNAFVVGPSETQYWGVH